MTLLTFSRGEWVLLVGVHVLQLGGVVLVDLLQELVGGLGGHACAGGGGGVGVEVVGGGSLEELVVVPCGKDRGSGQDGRRCLALGADDDVRGGARSWWEVVRGRSKVGGGGGGGVDTENVWRWRSPVVAVV